MTQKKKKDLNNTPLSRMFRKITQKAKEAVSTGNSNYADEVKDGLAKAKSLKRQLDDLLVVLAAHQKQQSASVEQSKALAAQFGKLGDAIKADDNDGSNAELAAHLAAAASWQTAFAEMQASFKKACDEWSEETTAFINTTYADAKKAEKAYDSARLMANAAADAVAKATKLDEKALTKANNELAVAQTALKDAQLTAADKLRYANVCGAVNLESHLRTYWNNVATHYKSGSQFLEAKRSTKEGIFASTASLKQDELARLSRIGATASLKADGDKGLANAAAKKPTPTPAPKPAAAAAAPAAAAAAASNDEPTPTTTANVDDEQSSSTPIAASNPFAASAAAAIADNDTDDAGTPAGGDNDDDIGDGGDQDQEKSEEKAKLAKTNPFAF
jgi:hypothetical protein